MPLSIIVALTAVRIALTTPGTGRHRRPAWTRRAAAAVRFAFGITQPADRYCAVHARRRYAHT